MEAFVFQDMVFADIYVVKFLVLLIFDFNTTTRRWSEDTVSVETTMDTKRVIKQLEHYVTSFMARRVVSKPVLLQYAIVHGIPINGANLTKATVVQSILAKWG